MDRLCGHLLMNRYASGVSEQQGDMGYQWLGHPGVGRVRKEGVRFNAILANGE